MKSLIVLRCVVAICFFFCTSPAQEKDQSHKQKYVVAPRESTLVTVASQSDCPLRIEDVQLLLNTDKSWDFIFSYQLRNRSDKPIRAFSVEFLTSEGTGGTVNDSRLGGNLLMPRHTIPAKRETGERTIVPLTDGLREKLNLGPPMRIVVVLIVNNVEFADGTRFTDEKTTEALKEYFQALGDVRD